MILLTWERWYGEIPPSMWGKKTIRQLSRELLLDEDEIVQMRRTWLANRAFEKETPQPNKKETK